MWRIVWGETWSVGVPTLDEEHRRFLGFVESLEQAIADKKDKRIVEGLILEVISETTDHFRHEERVLVEASFPGAEAHRNEHRRIEKLIRETAEAMQGFEDRAQWGEAALKIKTALLNHLVRFDMNYKWYFHDHPNKLPANLARTSA